MCIIGAVMKEHPDYPLIIAANRDEFIARPAEQAHWWEEGFVAGKDIKQGGTWIGISREGKIGAVTNIRNPKEQNSFPYSRGVLVPAWLTGGDLEAYMNKKRSFAGFNLLYGTVDKLHYETNGNGKSETIENGIFALSNTVLGKEWPKTAFLKKELTAAPDMNKEELIEHLFKALSRNDPFPETELPDTGVGLELEKSLSPPFINMTEYGTRCSTVILVSKNHQVTFIERSYRPERGEVKFHFNLEKNS
jgi:uncharacterized protein with NRDE domain